MHSFSRHNLWLIGVAIFLAAIVLQVSLWQQSEFTDQDLWVDRVVALHSERRQATYDPFNPLYSFHSGVPPLLVAALIHEHGADALASLQASVALLVAAGAAAAAWAAYRLQPWSPLWMVAGMFTAIHPLYTHASPTNAVAAGLLVPTVLVWLVLLRERYGFLPYAFLGAVLGALVFTRIELALFIAPLGLYLLIRHRDSPQKLFVLGASTIISALVFDPLLRHAPWEHVQSILFRSHANYALASSYSLTPWSVFINAPLTCAAIVTALFLVVPHRRGWPSFSRPQLVTLLLGSAAIAGPLLSVQMQSIRHLFPLIAVWDTLLFAFLFSWIRAHSAWSVRQQQLAWATLVLMSVLFVAVWFLQELL